MSDQFIREVDEEYRRERIIEIWRRYGTLIVVLAVALVAGVGGWRFWLHQQTQRAQAAATRFETAVQLSRDGKPEESERALAALVGDAPAGYRTLAQFRLAAETGRQNAESGAKAYDALAGDATYDGTLRDLARLRAAMLRLDTAPPADTERALEPLTVPSNPWRHTARELLGLAGLKRGDGEKASRWFDQIAADRETPPGLRQRLEIYTALAAGGPVQVTQ